MCKNTATSNAVRLDTHEQRSDNSKSKHWTAASIDIIKGAYKDISDRHTKTFKTPRRLGIQLCISIVFKSDTAVRE